jgi:GNAT superfamily N-acetyltransferase
MVTSPTTVLLKLATEEQKRARDALNYEAWGMLLTREQYGAREERLRAHAWSRDALTSWLLVDHDGQVLSSCEAYRMESFVQGSAGTTWGVASVFTERRLRGKGYASRMMALLVERLRELDPKAHAIVLYSDVGTAMYERSGFVVVGSGQDRAWSAEPGEPSAEIVTDAIELPRPGDPFVVWANAAQIDWHRERERAYAALLDRIPIATAGARAGDGAILWMTGVRADRLLILGWNGKNLEPLIQTARSVAAAAGLEKIVMWDQPGASGGWLEARVGGLPMLHAIDPRVRPEDWRTIPRAVWV